MSLPRDGVRNLELSSPVELICIEACIPRVLFKAKVSPEDTIENKIKADSCSTLIERIRQIVPLSYRDRIDSIQMNAPFDHGKANAINSILGTYYSTTSIMY